MFYKNTWRILRYLNKQETFGLHCLPRKKFESLQTNEQTRRRTTGYQKVHFNFQLFRFNVHVFKAISEMTKYLISINFLQRISATICFNVDGIFRRLWQFASEFITHIVAPLDWKKVSISAYIVAGDKYLCCLKLLVSAQIATPPLPPKNKTQLISCCI